MYNKSMRFIIILVSLSLSTAFGQTVSKAKERVEKINGQDVLLRSRMKSILELSFTYSFNHVAGTEVLRNTLTRISNNEGWDLVTITDPDQVTLQEVSKYTAILANNIGDWTNNQFPSAGKDAVEDFVANQGNGVLGVHGAGAGVSGAWDWYYNTFHPVGYDGHASRVTAPAIVADGADVHPIMENVLLEGERNTFAEFYRNRSHITESNPDVELLMKTDPARCSGCYQTQHIHPEGNHITWALPIGNGYHLFFPYGHDQREMDDFGPALEWDRFFIQAFYYIAGYDSLAIGCMDQGFVEYSATAEVEYPNKTAVCLTPNTSINMKHMGMDHRFGNNNPSIQIFQTGTHVVKLLDVLGMVVESKKLQGMESFTAKLDQLQSGIYFLRAKTANGRIYTKRYLIK